ncbi:uncharacterized protein [Bombus fervidus]|uniref:uncharacterized protein n=1 Tax=Bombus fervidus TaxID=203811 RepID=UPI003AB224EC
MELKGSAKSNRIRSSLKSKKLIAPKVEVITENVFVPITKTIFTKKRGDAMQCNFSVPKVEFVKLYRSNNGATMPLLKKPCSLLTNIISKHKVETSGKRLRSINKSYSFVNDKKVNFSQQPEIKKQQILIFPSSISDLPLTSFKRHSPAMDENVIKTSKRKKMDKINEKTRIGSINRISLNLPRTNGNDKKLKLHNSENVIRRSQNDTTRTRCLSSSSKEKIHLMENNILNNSIMPRNTSNVSITLSSAIPTATTKREDVEKQCIFDPYCESVLENIDVAIRGTISNSIINHGEGLKYPITHIESEAFNQLRCTMFDVSTSDNFLKTNGPDTIDTMHSKMLATRNFRHHSRENIGHSILSFLTNNRSQYQDSTNSNNNGRTCKIKYSWQVIGTSSQTSQTLLDNLVKESNLLDDESVCKCSVKYSWQIIGIATQTSQRDFTVSECRSAISFLSARTNTICHPIKEMICDSPPTATVWRKGKRFIILNNQYTQTFTHKECQTVFTELYKKYQN